MKKLLTIFLAVFSLTAFSQGISIATTVDEVTIYHSGALVKRTAKIPIKAESKCIDH